MLHLAAYGMFAVVVGLTNWLRIRCCNFHVAFELRFVVTSTRTVFYRGCVKDRCVIAASRILSAGLGLGWILYLHGRVLHHLASSIGALARVCSLHCLLGVESAVHTWCVCGCMLFLVSFDARFCKV